MIVSITSGTGLSVLNPGLQTLKTVLVANNEGSYYIVIPGYIRADKILSPYAKLLYGEIAVKATMKGYCYASNQHFADIFDVNIRSIQRYIKELEDGGFIQLELDKSDNGTDRRIFITEAARVGVTNMSPLEPVTNLSPPHDNSVTPGDDTNVIYTNKSTDYKESINNSVPNGTVPGPKSGDKASEGMKEPAGLYPRFMAVYDKWFKGFHDGVPPKLDGAQGTAAKSLIQYFTRIVNERAKKDGKIYDTVGIEYKVLEAWQYVLSNWHLLDTFLQKKTKLTDLSSNAQNIITQIKNGNSKTGNGGSGQKPATGANVSMADIASALNNKFAGPGAKGSQNPGGS